MVYIILYRLGYRIIRTCNPNEQRSLSHVSIDEIKDIAISVMHGLVEGKITVGTFLYFIDSVAGTLGARFSVKSFVTEEIRTKFNPPLAADVSMYKSPFTENDVNSLIYDWVDYLEGYGFPEHLDLKEFLENFILFLESKNPLQARENLDKYLNTIVS